MPLNQQELCFRIATLTPTSRQNLFTHLVKDSAAIYSLTVRQEALEEYASQPWQQPSLPDDSAAVPSALGRPMPKDPANISIEFLAASTQIARYYIAKIVDAKANVSDKQEALSRLTEEKIQTDDLHRALSADVEELYDMLLAPETLSITAPKEVASFRDTIRWKISLTLQRQIPYQSTLDLMSELKQQINEPVWNTKGFSIFEPHVPAGIEALRKLLAKFTGELNTEMEVTKFQKLEQKISALLNKKSSRLGGFFRDKDVAKFYQDFAAKWRALAQCQPENKPSLTNVLRLS